MLTANELNIIVSAKNLASNVLKTVGEDVKRFGSATVSHFEQAQEASEKFAIGLGIAGAAVTATIGKSATTFASFEKTMDAAGAVMNETSEEFEDLTDLAIEMGEKTSFSASESAGAIEMLAKNGLDASQILGGALSSSMSLAAAGSTDLSTAANVATDVMAIWKIESENMQQAVDGIAGVMTNSKFDINDFSLALAQGGGVAGAVGVEFDDFTASVAAMSPYFKSGSDAGTSFKVMLQRLVPTSKSAEEAMAQLGFITEDGSNQFFDAQGNMKSMAEISGILNEALKDLSDEQKNLYLSTIFGTDAMRGAAAMAEHTEESFNDLKKKIGDTSAEEIAREKLDNLAGGYEEMMGAIETTSITLGSKFSPVLRSVMDSIGDLARTITGSLNSIGDLGEWFENNSVGIAIFSGVLLGALTPAIWGVVTAVGGLTLALAPYMAAGAVIAGLIVGIKILIDGWGQFKTDVMVVWGAIVEGMKNLWNTISVLTVEVWTGIQTFFMGVWTSISTFVSEALTSIGNWFRSTWERIKTVTIEVFEFLRLFIVESIDILRLAWETGMTAISEVTNFLWNGIVLVISTAWEAIKNVLMFGLTILKGEWSTAWSQVKEIAQVIWNAIVQAFSAFFEQVKAVLASGAKIIQSAWSSVWGTAKSTVLGVFEEVKQVISEAVEWAAQKIQSLLDTLNSAKNAIKSAANTVSDVASSAGRFISDGVSNVFPFADGGIMTSGGSMNLPFNAYANGGIANSPQLALFGEGRMNEAYVPLPDGRTIPVTLKGGNQGGGSQTYINVSLNVQGSVTAERDLISTVAEGIANRLGIDHQIHY